MSIDELRDIMYSMNEYQLQRQLAFADQGCQFNEENMLRCNALNLDFRSVPTRRKGVEMRIQMFPGTPSRHVPTEMNLERRAPALRCSQVILPHSMTHRSMMNISNTNLNNPCSSVQIMPSEFHLRSTVNSNPHSVYLNAKLKPLPFFDVLGHILPPIRLATSHNNLYFHLSADQALTIQTESRIEIQLRIFMFKPGCEQVDNFPPNIYLEVNNNLCQLPGNIQSDVSHKKPKQPSGPVDITAFCNLSSRSLNNILVSFYPSCSSYGISVNLVRHLDSSELVSRLRSTAMRNPDHTRAMIRKKLTQGSDSEIGTTSLKTTLICPIGRMRMKMPCRPMTCTHLQCFDLDSFLKMNEKKPSWVCAVCDRPANIHSLIIDGLFSEILTNSPLNCKDVEFHADGSWSPVLENRGIDGFSIGTSVTNLKRKFIDLTGNHGTDERPSQSEPIDLTTSNNTRQWHSNRNSKKAPLASWLKSLPRVIQLLSPEDRLYYGKFCNPALDAAFKNLFRLGIFSLSTLPETSSTIVTIKLESKVKYNDLEIGNGRDEMLPSNMNLKNAMPNLQLENLPSIMELMRPMDRVKYGRFCTPALDAALKNYFRLGKFRVTLLPQSPLPSMFHHSASCTSTSGVISIN